MNCKEIVEKYLKDNGYDGIAGEECGCVIGDLMPCGEFGYDCVPGYIAPCPGPEECPLGGDCEFHISTEKQEQRK